MKFLFLSLLLFSSQLWAQTSVQETNASNYSPWSLSAFSLLASETDQANEGGSVFTYNYIGPNYRLNFDERIALKVPFTMSSSGYNRFAGECNMEQDSALADPFINYTNYNLALLPGEVDVYWDGRVYLPLSKTSRRQKMIGRLRSNAILSRLLTQRLSVEWRNEFNYYHQSQSTYVAQGINQECQVADNAGPSNTRRFRMDNWLTMWYRINRTWSVGLVTVFREDIRNNSSTVDTGRQRNGRLKETSVRGGPTVKWIANNNLSFIATFSDFVEYSGFHPNRQDDFSDFGKFKAENTVFNLNTFIRF